MSAAEHAAATSEISAPQSLPGAGRPGRQRAISRAITVVVVALTFGTLLIPAASPWVIAADMLLRAYLMFIGTVMAHEAVHGHLARSRRWNAWWGRLALLPVMVTYSKFRRTHLLHHAHTNDPQRDPDYFLHTDREWELPLRALLMPHQWALWLRRRGQFTRRDALAHLLTWLSTWSVYGVLIYFAGWQRVLLGALGAMTLVSWLLWYPFAVKTHEGYSRGAAETRSHDYYGALLFWLSCGLSLHRVHHLQPGLSWLAMRSHVRPAPATGWRRLLPQRDIIITGDGPSAGKSLPGG